MVLELSERGHARLDEVRASRRALMAMVTEKWTAEERDAFTTLLTRFNTSLADITALAPGGPAPS